MICGGQDYVGNALSSCWRLNPNGTWTAGEQMLQRRYAFTMTAVEDEVILIGGAGGITTHDIALRDVEKYPLGKHEGWSKMKDAPKTISRHCTVMLNTSFLMVIVCSQNAQVNSN